MIGEHGLDLGGIMVSLPETIMCLIRSLIKKKPPVRSHPSRITSAVSFGRRPARYRVSETSAPASCDVDAYQTLAGVPDRFQIGMAARAPPNELSDRSHETFGSGNSVGWVTSLLAVVS
jgi:hypothetical protein